MRDAIIDRVEAALAQDGIRGIQRGEEDGACFILGEFPAKSVPAFRFMLWNGKKAFISARVGVLTNVPPEKYGDVLYALNRLNVEHQWAKFVLREDINSVQAIYDYPIDYKVGKALDHDYVFYDKVGRAVADLLEFLVIVADEAYPRLTDILHS